MILLKLLVPIGILLALVFGVYIVVCKAKPKSEVTSGDIERTVGQLKQLIAEAERDNSNGIIAAEARLVTYKSELDKITKTKTKTDSL